MLKTNYIRCHGSGNRFLLFDAVAEPRLEALADHPALVKQLCATLPPNDGVLLTVAHAEGYGMRMFNTDGSEAEMCGNGIRCVARQTQHYVGDTERTFCLWSGGKSHQIHHEEPLFEEIPTYRVAIAIRTASAAFPRSLETGSWIGRPIPELDDALRFTFLDLGNPHLVAEVEQIRLEQLTALGERVKQLQEVLPKGVNISLFRHTGDQAIYTATYERGVGLTSSCGTAMTACSTAACLLGLCRSEEPIVVSNSGGLVHCNHHRSNDLLTTTLSGNATFEGEGELTIDFEHEQIRCNALEQPRSAEIESYQRFLNTIR